MFTKNLGRTLLLQNKIYKTNFMIVYIIILFVIISYFSDEINWIVIISGKTNGAFVI